MEFSEKIFIDPRNPIQEDVDIVFVSDMFVEDYVGGAELTTEALISESPFRIQKLRSREVTLSALKNGYQKYWLFGNFSQMNPELIPTIVGNIRYSILEYDYKYCKHRSPEKHSESEGTVCDCHNQLNGKITSAFFYGAQNLWWMSQKQKERYHQMFPFLAEKENYVISSVFSKETLGKMKLLRETFKDEAKSGWIVLGSNSWVKGFDAAKRYCEDKGHQHEVIWDRPYDQVLSKLATSEGFVYLPKGGDTCPRMVIEAKLLGCKLVLNDFVQHKDEEWFETEDVESIHEYLFASPQFFWKITGSKVNKTVEISGYTTTYNCASQGYPFVRSVRSMLTFCDEVCIVDGGSTDGTYETLLKLAEEANVEKEVIKVKQINRDWENPRHALFDGMQKAAARGMCTKEFCWQMDVDEVVHEDDAKKVIELCSKVPKGVDLISLPVIEYWGGPEKVRIDIQPWKWRLSRNLPHITHGIPSHLRKLDTNGKLCALPGTDGCDMIHTETGEPLPHVTFHTPDTEKLRQMAAAGNQEALQKYQEWFNEVIQNIPGVHHYSWYDIARKIKTYKNYWTRHWNSLYDGSLEDTSETNMMFDLPWSQVTDEMIEAKAVKLEQETGGWIWHRKWRGERTPHITVTVKEPHDFGT